MRSSARGNGDHFLLNGSKTYISNSILPDAPEAFAFIKAGVADVVRGTGFSKATTVSFGRAFHCSGYRQFKITQPRHLAALVRSMPHAVYAFAWLGR